MFTSSNPILSNNKFSPSSTNKRITNSAVAKVCEDLENRLQLSPHSRWLHPLLIYTDIIHYTYVFRIHVYWQYWNVNNFQINSRSDLLSLSLHINNLNLAQMHQAHLQMIDTLRSLVMRILLFHWWVGLKFAKTEQRLSIVMCKCLKVNLSDRDSSDVTCARAS